MELLIDRGVTYLTKTEGTADVEDDVPDFLKVARIVPTSRVTESSLQARNLRANGPIGDLLLANESDFCALSYYLNSHLRFSGIDRFLHRLATRVKIKRKPLVQTSVPAFWSGYRSVVVRDPETGRLFRLKGVSFNPDKPALTEFESGGWEVHGGQPLQSAKYEKQMSDKFNRVLLDNGVEPVMTCRGLWRYPKRVKRKMIAGSVVEIQGDTRLDELSHVLEILAFRKLYNTEREENGVVMFTPTRLTSEGENFFKALQEFYYNVGFVSGRLKKLMDKAGQTWSADSDRTNAHMGNIVLYNGSDKVKVGFVDFDASCDSSEFTKSELRDMHKREYDTIMRSFIGGPISARSIGDFFNGGRFYFPEARSVLQRGFQEGYEHIGNHISNEVDLGLLQETFALLRGEGMFSVKPAIGFGTGLEVTIFKEEKKIKGIDLDDIVRKNRGYQENLELRYGEEDDYNKIINDDYNKIINDDYKKSCLEYQV